MPNELRPTDLGLVFEVLANLAGREVPDFDEAVDGPGDQVLAVRGELGAFHVRLLAKLRISQIHSVSSFV